MRPACRYHELKSPRKLTWVPDQGVVELEVEVGDISVQFRVSPLRATILGAFADQERWSSSALAGALGLPAGALRKAILFWVNLAVVVEVPAAGPGGATGLGVPGAGGGGGGAGGGAAFMPHSPGQAASLAEAADPERDVVYQRAQALDPSLHGACECMWQAACLAASLTLLTRAKGPISVAVPRPLPPARPTPT